MPRILQFSECASVVAGAVIEIIRPCQMCFSSIGSQPNRGLKCGFGGGQPASSVIEAQRIKASVNKGQLVVSLEKGGIACRCLVKKLNRLPQVLLTSGGERCRDK